MHLVADCCGFVSATAAARSKVPKQHFVDEGIRVAKFVHQHHVNDEGMSLRAIIRYSHAYHSSEATSKNDNKSVVPHLL